MKKITTLCALVISALPLANSPNPARALQKQPVSEQRGVLYPVEYQNRYFPIMLNRIYEVTLRKGDSFNKWWENEEWVNEDFKRTPDLLTIIIEYINKKPFDLFALKESQKINIYDLDNDGFGMGRSLSEYGRMVTEQEMDAILKNNITYDNQVKK